MHTDHTPYFSENISECAPWVTTHGLVAPYGECQCGCGQKTRIARQDNPQHGHRKGQPLRYVMNHRSTPITLAAKFWSIVTPGQPGECWECTEGVKGSGYARFCYRSTEHQVHRVSYELHHGEIPDGLLVCHKCDNRRCWNPEHLFLGTNAENTADKVAKNRQAKGEANGNVRLTESEIIEIRKLYEEGVTQVAIAERFGIYQGNVSAIVLHKSWKHLG